MVKTILITGAGRGIGLASVVALAKRGHDVIATVHKESSIEVVRAAAEQAGVTIETFVLDVLSAKDREKILEYDLDVLINNAAIGETGSLAEIEMDKVRQNFEVNVFAGFSAAQLALRRMIKKNTGRIIFVSSLLGRISSPFFGPYSMTKFAVSSGAEMLRQELELITDNVHVSLIEPGAYHTGFNQKMIAKKFEWMDNNSYFANIKDALKRKEERSFAFVEVKSIESIVKKVVEAVEAEKPKLRYVAPWWQGLYVTIMRAFGK